MGTLFTSHERPSAGVASRAGQYFIYPYFKTTAGVYPIVAKI
jgi:hypothetical protein